MSIKDQILKWTIFFILFFIGLFCFMKDWGYCNEFEEEYIDFAKEFNYVFPNPPIPVEDEYLYQYRTQENHLNSRFYNAKWVDPRNHVWKDDPRQLKNSKKEQQRKEWQAEYDQHHFDAVRTFNEAYNRVWWLPNLTWRQWGRDAWIAACAMVSTKTPSAALAVAFSAMLSQYGLHCMDEYEDIQEKLHWSNYHFTECVKYAQLLHG